MVEVFENEANAKIIERKGCAVMLAPHLDISRVCIMDRSFRRDRAARSGSQTCYGICHPP
jgi:hypothetical protein